MAPRIIKSIDSLRNLPMFPDEQSVSGLPSLRRYNLLYGFNGCGKTTLARVFDCLGTGKRYEGWSVGSSFSVTLTDGEQINQNSVDPALTERIVVFSTDFIDQSFRWIEAEANPIFYIGRSQGELSDEVEKKTKRAALVKERSRRVEATRAQADRAFTQHKRDRARLVETEVELGRRYNALNLESDYAGYKYDSVDQLTDEEVDAQRRILRQDEPLPRIPRISEEASEALSDLIHDTRNLLQETLGRISLEALQEHDEMLPWVKKGLEYHQARDLGSCLFCGNQVTEERLRLLGAAIDNRYDEMLDDISAVWQRAKTLREDLVQLKSTLPSKNDVARHQQRDFASAAAAVRSSIEDGCNQAEIAMNYLSQKQASPNSVIAPDALAEVSQADEWVDAYADRARRINSLIDIHNTAHENFQSIRTAAKERLRKHFLAEGYEAYCELKSRFEKAERVLGALESRASRLFAEIDTIKQQVRQHGPAADRVNEMIRRYLGHDELEVAAKDEGYEIRRHGRVTTSAPSEGEKTAIALSYFLVLLESDGRRREDLIVVMDDPISSLDTRSLNYACSLIKSLHSVAQLVVLTHNPHVMNEMKKWLRRRTERELTRRNRSQEDATATLLFVDTVQPGGEGSRRSKVTELPKHLRDHESEYHYLFHMILRFLSSEKARGDYLFVMPNVLRKVLEVFLAFKLPGSDGLGSKIESLARKSEAIGIDELRIRALGRLSHVESHGDNLDDLVAISSMTIEETTKAAEVLLDVIGRMDPEHSERMRSQCRA